MTIFVHMNGQFLNYELVKHLFHFSKIILQTNKVRSKCLTNFSQFFITKCNNTITGVPLSIRWEDLPSLQPGPVCCWVPVTCGGSAESRTCRRTSGTPLPASCNLPSPRWTAHDATVANSRRVLFVNTFFLTCTEKNLNQGWKFGLFACKME